VVDVQIHYAQFVIMDILEPQMDSAKPVLKWLDIAVLAHQVELLLVIPAQLDIIHMNLNVIHVLKWLHIAVLAHQVELLLVIPAQLDIIHMDLNARHALK